MRLCFFIAISACYSTSLRRSSDADQEVPRELSLEGAGDELGSHPIYENTDAPGDGIEGYDGDTSRPELSTDATFALEPLTPADMGPRIREVLPGGLFEGAILIAVAVLLRSRGLNFPDRFVPLSELLSELGTKKLTHVGFWVLNELTSFYVYDLFKLLPLLFPTKGKLLLKTAAVRLASMIAFFVLMGCSLKTVNTFTHFTRMDLYKALVDSHFPFLQGCGGENVESGSDEKHDIDQTVVEEISADSIAEDDE